MPGYILHLAAAKMLIDKLPSTHRWRRDKEERDAFYTGNLIPDTVKNKALTHFRNQECNGHILEYPDLKIFLDKYQHLMNDSSCQGYLFHLYLDRCFLLEYVPTVAEFLDRNGSATDLKEDLDHVRLRKNGECLTWKQYLSDEYYYGDYTRMNAWIQKRFCPEIEFIPSINNPGIEEVSYENITSIIEELKQFSKGSEEQVYTLKVFELKSIEKFLEKAVEDWIDATEFANESSLCNDNNVSYMRKNIHKNRECS